MTPEEQIEQIARLSWEAGYFAGRERQDDATWRGSADFFERQRRDVFKVIAEIMGTSGPR